MKKINRSQTNLFLVLVLLSLNFSFGVAQTTQWIGAVDSNWNNAGNWDNGVPIGSSQAIIGSAGFSPAISSAISIQGLDIEVGATLNVNSGSLTVTTNLNNEGALHINGANTTVSGNFQNSGTVLLSANRTLRIAANLNNDGVFSIAQPSTVEFNGTGNHQLSGSNSINFSNLTINKSGGGSILLTRDINLSNDLIINNGSLQVDLNIVLTLNGNLTNNSLFISSNPSTCRLQGTGTNTISGTGITNFDQLEILKTGGVIQINQDILIHQNCQIPVGVTVVLGASRKLSLDGQLINQGTIDLSSNGNTVAFTGNSTVSLAGSGLSIFQNLEVDKSGAGQLTLNTDIIVQGDLAILNGFVQLNTSNTLSLYKNLQITGILNTQSNSRVILQGTGNHTLSGTSPLDIKELILNKTNGNLNINQSLTLEEDFTIPPAVICNLASGMTLSLGNDFTNNGNLNAASGSMVNLTGAGTNTIAGTNPCILDFFQLSKTSGTVSIDQNLQVNQTFTIPTGVLFSLQTNRRLTCNQLIINQGVFDSSQPGSTLIFGGTSNIAISATGINTFRNLEMAKSGGGTLTIDQSISVLEDLTLSTGTATLNSFMTISLSGNLHNLATFSAANGSILELKGPDSNFLDGTNALVLSQWIINKVSGNVEIGLDLSISNNMIIPAGVNVILKTDAQLSISQNFLNYGDFNAETNSIFDIRGTGLTSIGGTKPSNFYTLQISKTAGSIILSQNVRVVRDLSIPTGVSMTLSSGFLLALENDFTINGSFTAASTSSLEFSGSATSVISGGSSLNIGYLIINKTGGGVNCQMNINISQDFNLNIGTFTLYAGRSLRLSGNFLVNGTFSSQTGGIFEVSGTATNLFSGTAAQINFDIFQISKTAGTIEYATDISIIQNLTIPAGVSVLLHSGHILRLSNNLINHGILDNSAVGNTVIFEGASSVSVSGTGTHDFRNLTLNKSGGATLTLSALVRIFEDLTVTQGRLILGSGQQITLHGDFTNHGALFDPPNPSTFEFAGNGNQIFDGSFNFNFRTVIVSKTGGIVTFNRNTIFYENLQIPLAVNFTLNAAEFRLDGNLSIEGSLIQNTGLFRMGGTTAALVSGSGTPQFRDLTIDKNNTATLVDFQTDLIVIRDFRIIRGTFTLNTNRTMTVYEDFRRDNTGVFNASANSTVIFTGDLISLVLSSSVSFNNLTINKTALNPATNVQASVRIENNLNITVNNHLQLTRGRIITAYSARLLILGNAATSSSAHVDSFVDGPMRKIGNTAFIFPIGKDGRTGRIAINPTVAGVNTDFFTAEYFAITFGNSSLNSPPLGDASDREYWRLERNGTTTVSVRLYWESGTVSGLNGPNTTIDPALLKIGQWNDAADIWETREGFNLNGAFDMSGYIESAPGQDIFGQFKHWTFVYEQNNLDWGIVTWIGEIDNNWHNRLNWSPAEVPTDLNDVWLIGDRTFFPSIDTAAAIAKSLNISSDISPGVQAVVLPTLTINDTLRVVGTGAGGEINCSGTIFNNSVFNGNWRLTIQDEGQVVNHGTIRMLENAALNDNALLLNYQNFRAVDILGNGNSDILNEGFIQIDDDLDIRNNHQFTNNHTLIILDEIFGRNDARLINQDSLLVYEKITMSNNFIIDNFETLITGYARAGTISLNNNSRINNSSSATLTVQANPSPGSIVLSTTASILNQGLITCGLDFRITAATASVSNENLIQVRQNFENNGIFSGNGILEFYDDTPATSRIYGSTNPAFSHRLILSKTSGLLQVEQNIEVTEDLIIPSYYTVSVFPNIAISLLANFVNDGVLNAQTNSSVIFTGGNNASISGDQPIAFYHLVNQKTGAALTSVDRPIRIAGDLNNNGGILEITANRSIHITNSGALNNQATLNNLGTLHSTGFLYNNAGATLDNRDTLTVYQNENRGTIINQNNANFYTNYRTNNRGTGLITNNGRYYSDYYHDNYDNSLIVNSGTLSTAWGIYSYNNAQVINNNSGTISTLAADYANRNSSITQNFGVITTGRHLELISNGQLINSGTITAQQNVYVRDLSILTNNGTITATYDVFIQNNGQFINNHLLRLQDDFENQRIFTGTGTIEFFGNNASSRIYGTNPVFSHQLIINKTGGQIDVENSITVINTLTNPEAHQLNLVNGTITLQQSLFNHGNLQGSAGTELVFTQAGDDTLHGNGTTSLYDLSIEKSGGALLILEQDLTVNNDFNNTGGHFRLNSNIKLNIGGDIVNNSTFEAQHNSIVTFFGNSAFISGSSPLEFYDLIVDKDGLASATLNREITIKSGGHLTLTSGLINSSNTHLLVLQDDATSSTGSAASFVNGPMRKIGDDPFVFPLGKGTKWARLEISDLNLSQTNDYFEAQYYPFGYGDYTVDSTLNHVSLLEYWDLKRGNTLSGTGTTEALVSIYWQDPVFTDLVNVSINDLKVAHFEAGKWTDKGGIVSGNLSQGKITTDFRQNNFSPWTFASKTGVNPLPLSLVSFEARKIAERTIQLDWATTAEVNTSHFEIQRSNDAQNFESLGLVDAVGNSNNRQNYQFTDFSPLSGTSYYRLKMVDADASFSYSPIRSVRLEGDILPEISQLFPNPFITDLNLELRLNPQENYQIRLVDMLGRDVFQKQLTPSQVSISKLRLELATLSSGTYLLVLEGKSIKIAKRVIKQ